MRARPPRSLAGLAAPLLLAPLLLAGSVRAATVERIVAVIGENAILLTDLRLRARPYLAQLQQRFPSGAQLAAAQSEMLKQLLERMVDERLEQQQADKSRITVTSEEIDAGIRNVASQQGITVDDLLTEAQRSGLSVQDYRDEIRRQILEGKLLQLRVKGRVRVTDEDVRAMYGRIVRAERKRLAWRPAWVVLHLPEGASPAARDEREQLARSIAATARAGVDAEGRPVDFASLAASFSDDVATREHGGDLGKRQPGDLAQVLEDEGARLAVGEVSAPFRYKDAIVVLTVLERDPSQIPPLTEAHDEVAQRVYGEQMDKARRQWLDELRRGIYVDVRL